MTSRSISQKADIIGTFRHVSVFLMETLARWTPLTPELEVKILLGRHLWEFAQHADVLGRRTAELRAGLHYTRPPLPAYRHALEEMASFEAAPDRLGAVYDVLVPDLMKRYGVVVQEADPLLDQPSIQIVQRILQDLARLQVERHEMLTGATLPPGVPERTQSLRSRLAAEPEFVDFRPLKEATS